jgi:hypothetical protein
MGVRMNLRVNLVGGLDAHSNCEVGIFEVNGIVLKNQMAQASYEVDIKQEWARANDMTRTIKMTDSLVATTTEGATVTQGSAPMCGTTHRMPSLTQLSACTR